MQSKTSALDEFSKLLEKKIKIDKKERDLVFMQNSFLIKQKDGEIINKKYDLLIFGNHNNLPYTATSFLVGYPAAIIAQVFNNIYIYLTIIITFS